jgi:hypothetical protein
MKNKQKENNRQSTITIEEEFNQLQKTIIKTAIEHRQNVLDSSVKSHAGLLLRNGYGGLMTDYNKELRKIEYLKDLYNN